MAIYLPPDPMEVREIARAIETLTDVDYRRLDSFARALCRARRNVVSDDGRDLTQEAVLRTLRGTRKCPKEVGIAEHLMGTVRSIASQKLLQGLAKLDMEKRLRFQTTEADLTDAAPEEASNIVQRLRLLLAADTEATSVLESMLAGHRPDETRRLLAMKANTYNAARQRIRRRAKLAADAEVSMCRHRTFRSPAHRKTPL